MCEHSQGFSRVNYFFHLFRKIMTGLIPHKGALIDECFPTKSLMFFLNSRSLREVLFSRNRGPHQIKVNSRTMEKLSEVVLVRVPER